MACHVNNVVTTEPAQPSQTYLGGNFTIEFRHPSAGLGLICGGTLDVPEAVNSLVDSKRGANLWADAATLNNVVKASRVLKIHTLKQSARVSSRLLGLNSSSMSMVFVLRKFPSDLSALQLALPHSLGHPSEALFLRNCKGKKVLSAQFGRGDMDLASLVTNAMAVVAAARNALDAHLVSEILLVADRLTLPVWNRKLFDRGKRSLSRKTAAPGKRTSMGPPALPPVKKSRVS